MNLFFDVDDTLYDQLEPFSRAFHQVYGASAEPSLCEEIYRLSRIYSDQVFDEAQAGHMTMEDMYVYRISYALRDCHLPTTRAQALQFQTAYATYQQEITLIPEMAAVLDWCRSHTQTLGIITNGPTTHQKEKIRALGLTRWIAPDHIFVSEEMQVSKPDVRLFHLVQAQLHLDPARTWYIGDSFQNDVIGAKRAGWKAIWLNRRSRPMPQDTPVRPDYVVGGREGDLLELVKRLLH